MTRPPSCPGDDECVHGAIEATDDAIREHPMTDNAVPRTEAGKRLWTDLHDLDETRAAPTGDYLGPTGALRAILDIEQEAATLDSQVSTEGAGLLRARVMQALDDLDPNDEFGLQLRLLLTDLRAALAGQPLPRAGSGSAATQSPAAPEDKRPDIDGPECWSCGQPCGHVYAQPIERPPALTEADEARGKLYERGFIAGSRFEKAYRATKADEAAAGRPPTGSVGIRTSEPAPRAITDETIAHLIAGGASAELIAFAKKHAAAHNADNREADRG